MVQYEAVIGLEVHAQLSTESKIFAQSATVAMRSPNTLTDPVTLGLPGSLPVLNRRTVEYAIRLGLATECEIARESVFARKHYFYPDLPKGYQISQYDKPICKNGKLSIRYKDQNKVVGITRIHLEEDAGKNVHQQDQPYSVVDLNRAGVPLVEIVSEPDIRSAEEAGAYMRQLRQILRYLDICDGNMEEGSLRCDANVSIRPVGTEPFGTKVEIKNLNSFRFVEKAITYEIQRQTSLKDQGKEIAQETRMWDESSATTKSMRSKEHAQDYRYFPDPDLLPLIVDQDWVTRIRESLPELPKQTSQRLQRMYGLDEYYCELLSEEKLVAHYYDQAVAIHHNPSSVANWIITELFGRLNRDGLDMSKCPISPEDLAALVRLIDEDVISGKIAKGVFDEMFSSGISPVVLVEKQGLRQNSNREELAALVDAVVGRHPNEVEAYLAGKTKMLGFFVGQIMKETGGKANPKLVNELLDEKLKAPKE